VATVPGLSRFTSPPGDERPDEERSFSPAFVTGKPDRFRHCVEIGRTSRHGADSTNSQISIFVSHDACERLPTLQVPTTVVCGSEDTTFPFENSRVLAELIPGAELVEIAGAGHAVHMEQSSRLASIIRQRTA
jgi:pimeloyl-ACP methyl ester carboxylesterase